MSTQESPEPTLRDAAASPVDEVGGSCNASSFGASACGITFVECGYRFDVNYVSTPLAAIFIALAVVGFAGSAYLESNDRFSMASAGPVLSVLLGLVAFLSGSAIVMSCVGARTAIRAWLEQLSKDKGQNDADYLGKRIDGLLAEYEWLSPQLALRVFLRRLVAAGVTGVAMRVRGGESPSDIEPLGVGFEPTPLSSAAWELDETVEKPQVWKRRIPFGGVLFYVFFIGLQFILSYLPFSGFRLSGLFRDLAQPLPIVLLQIILVLIVIAVVRRRKWFVVPGGMVRYQGTMFRRHARVRLFDRDSCALAVFPIRNSDWKFLVVCKGACESGKITRAEATVLLRAWLATVPTTRADQLCDLQ